MTCCSVSITVLVSFHVDVQRRRPQLLIGPIEFDDSMDKLIASTTDCPETTNAAPTELSISTDDEKEYPNLPKVFYDRSEHELCCKKKGYIHTRVIRSTFSIEFSDCSMSSSHNAHAHPHKSSMPNSSQKQTWFLDNMT